MRQLRPLFLILLCALGLVFGASAPASAILNGEPDGDRHPYVALLYNNSVLCSGVTISPTLVLTADHCLGLGDDFYVSFDEDPQPRYANNWPHPSAADATGTGMTIGEFCGRTPQGCAPGLIGFFASSDVAVVVLDAAVNLARYAELPTTNYIDQLPANQVLTAVGYGADSVSRDGGRPTPVASVQRLTTPMTLAPTSGPVSEVTVRARSGGRTGPCYGDSGGPLLLGDTVLGVLSGGASPTCSSHAYYSRVDLQQILGALDHVS